VVVLVYIFPVLLRCKHLYDIYVNLDYVRKNKQLPGPGVRCKSSSNPPCLLRPVNVYIGACFFTLWTVFPSMLGKPYAFGAKRKDETILKKTQLM
jgi:hypothetical protein